jgi:transposase
MGESSAISDVRSITGVLGRILFANKNSTRMKVLVYDGLGIWLAARRLNKGRFIWTNGDLMIATALNPEQLQALVMGLPWRTLAHDHAITVV